MWSCVEAEVEVGYGRLRRAHLSCTPDTLGESIVKINVPSKIVMNATKEVDKIF